MLHRKHFMNLIKINATTGDKPSKGKVVKDDHLIINEMINRQNLLMSSYEQWDMEDGIRWIVGYANYINHNYYKKFNKYNTRSFTKGTILMTDFFGSFGNELTFDHPAIVLADTGSGLIVAPLTSSPAIYGDSNYFHIDLPKGITGFGKLTKDSTIKLEQLRYISKTRILAKKDRVSEAGKLKEIDEALMQYLASKTFNNLTSENATLQQENVQLNKQNDQLTNENAQLKAGLEQIIAVIKGLTGKDFEQIKELAVDEVASLTED
ncbi:MAG TPA: hypothetical protein DG757_18685 [Bacillus sp. (in: Bacteria)]|nr:hypothetical protein [Bacillus sp. (in: firmicutes)]